MDPQLTPRQWFAHLLHEASPDTACASLWHLESQAFLAIVDRLAICDDPMPPTICDMLDLPLGSTFRQGMTAITEGR